MTRVLPAAILATDDPAGPTPRGRASIHPADLTVDDAGAAIRAGRMTCLDLARAHLDRIAERDEAIGAFVHVAAEDAMAAAQAADADLAAGRDRGPLHGIPFAVKDVIDVRGWPVRFGSRAHEDRIASETAPAVRAMIRAGAVPVGLTATYELATVGPDATSLYPQPRNPWDHAHVTGGSSSGAAAAVASGMVRIALGTDTGGSIRSPAAYCGIAGLKPTRGAVSMEGVMPLAPSLDHLGPLARTAREAALTFAALTGTPLPAHAPTLAGLRIGYARRWCDAGGTQTALLDALDAAVSVLSLAGARITLVDLPPYPPIEAAAAAVLRTEQAVSQAGAFADGGARVGLMARASISAPLPSTDEMEAARRILDEASAGIEASLAEADAIVLATAMDPAPPFSAFAGGKPMWTPMRTIPFNATGHPAISIPMGFASHLPLGLQIVGAHGAEASILRIAEAFEAATDHGAQTPPVRHCMPG